MIYVGDRPNQIVCYTRLKQQFPVIGGLHILVEQSRMQNWRNLKIGKSAWFPSGNRQLANTRES